MCLGKRARALFLTDFNNIPVIDRENSKAKQFEEIAQAAIELGYVNPIPVDYTGWKKNGEPKKKDLDVFERGVVAILVSAWMQEGKTVSDVTRWMYAQRMAAR